MFWIILLAVIGLVLFFVELVLLPGITIAALGATAAFGTATVLAFTTQTTEVGFWVLGAELVSVGLITTFFFRPKTWHKVALHTEIKNSVAKSVESRFAIGDKGKALTRLAPMGNVIISNQIVEAKTRSGYIDEGCQIEVIGFDNHNVIVRSETV